MGQLEARASVALALAPLCRKGVMDTTADDGEAVGRRISSTGCNEKPRPGRPGLYDTPHPSMPSVQSKSEPLHVDGGPAAGASSFSRHGSPRSLSCAIHQFQVAYPLDVPSAQLIWVTPTNVLLPLMPSYFPVPPVY